MLAYKLVEPWVRAWAMPPQEAAAAATDEQGRPLPPVYGACVNLRLHGQLIGRGQSLAFAADDKPDTGHIVRAVAAAIADADPRLPVANDLNRDAAVKLLTPDIQISLELAGAPKLITDDTWTLVDTGLAPGLDGLACRAGKSDDEVAFPSAMMMGNLLPQRVLRGMIANAIGEGGAAEALLAPKLIRDKHVLTMASFRVSHLAQCAPGREPEFLYRGARLVSTSATNRQEIEDVAWKLAQHLRARVSQGQIPTNAEPAERRSRSREIGNYAMLSAVAMNAYGDMKCSRLTAEERERFLVAVRAILVDGLTGPVQQSLNLLARLPSGKANSLSIARSQTLVEGALKEAASGISPDVSDIADGWKAEVAELRFSGLSSVQRALVLYSYATYCHASGVQRDQDSLEAGMRTIFSETDESQLVALMPWLGWAELNAADVGAIGTEKSAEIPAAIALRQMRAEVWKHQLSVLDAGSDGADMVGGIVFTSGPSTPFPTWQTVRPIAFIATMLGDDRLTEPAERDIELFRLLQAFRFLRQLQVDDSCGWMCPNPEAAIGGIRAATWDQSMPPDATSLTLLATCELLKSMDKLAATKAAETKPKDEPVAAP